jgi:hypothetical protein
MRTIKLNNALHCNSSMLNKKLPLLFLLLIMSFSMLITFSSALDNMGVKQVDKQFTFCQICSDASYITLSSVETPNSTEIVNSNMASMGGGQYCYNYTPNQIGRYDFRGISDGCEKSFAVYVDVTAYGNESNEANAIIYTLLLLFFIGSIIGLVFLDRKIDYNKWNEKIYSEYEHKNYIKLVFSSIIYNLMKNTFTLYYLLGLPIALIITDIAYVFNISNVYSVLQAFLVVYMVGIIIIGIVLFSYVQEWSIDLLNKFKNDAWGL